MCLENISQHPELLIQGRLDGHVRRYIRTLQMRNRHIFLLLLNRTFFYPWLEELYLKLSAVLGFFFFLSETEAWH